MHKKREFNNKQWIPTPAKTNQKIQVTMTEVEVGAWELMTNMNPPGDVSVALAQTRLLNRDYEVMERWVKTGFFTKVCYSW